MLIFNFLINAAEILPEQIGRKQDNAQKMLGFIVDNKWVSYEESGILRSVNRFIRNKIFSIYPRIKANYLAIHRSIPIPLMQDYEILCVSSPVIQAPNKLEVLTQFLHNASGEVFWMKDFAQLSATGLEKSRTLEQIDALGSANLISSNGTGFHTFTDTNEMGQMYNRVYTPTGEIVTFPQIHNGPSPMISNNGQYVACSSGDHGMVHFLELADLSPNSDVTINEDWQSFLGHKQIFSLLNAYKFDEFLDERMDDTEIDELEEILLTNNTHYYQKGADRYYRFQPVFMEFSNNKFLSISLPYHVEKVKNQVDIKLTYVDPQLSSEKSILLQLEEPFAVNPNEFTKNLVEHKGKVFLAKNDLGKNCTFTLQELYDFSKYDPSKDRLRFQDMSTSRFVDNYVKKFEVFADKILLFYAHPENGAYMKALDLNTLFSLTTASPDKPKIAETLISRSLSSTDDDGWKKFTSPVENNTRA